MNSLSFIYLYQIVYSLILLWGILYDRFLKRMQTVFLALVLLLIFFVENMVNYKVGIFLFFIYSLLKAFLVYKNYKSYMITALSSTIIYSLFFAACFFSLDFPRFSFNLDIETNRIPFILFMIIGALVLTIICYGFRRFTKSVELSLAFSSIEKKQSLLSITILIIYFLVVIFHHLFMYPYNPHSIVFSFTILFFCGIVCSLLILWIVLSYINKKRENQLYDSFISIRNHYETTLEFRHDYKNILRSIWGFLEQNDIHGAKAYLSKITNYSSSMLLPNFHYQLEKLEILPVQAIIASYGEEMGKLEIPFTLFVKNNIVQLDVDTIDLIRCLSILLANAKEEVSTQVNGRINITISKSNNLTTFLIRNTLTHQVSLNEITKKRFTTKSGHMGRGLSIVRRVTSQYNNFDCTFQIEQGLFIALLEVRNIEDR